MKTTLLRAGGLACALMTSTALCAPALAQSGQLPRYDQADANGVDLVTGQLSFSLPEGSIGSGEGSLALARNWVGGVGWTDNWSGILYTRTVGSSSELVVEFGSYSDTFSISGTTYTSTKADGATLVAAGNGYLYTARDGTQITFAERRQAYYMTGPACARSATAACAIPVLVLRPNGMRYSLTWDRVEICNQVVEGLCTDGDAYPRFRSVTNAANYSVTLNYATNTPGSGVPVADWYVRTGAQFTNLDTAPGTLPTVTYGGGALPTSVTDIGGQTWSFSYTGGVLTAIRRPGATADTTTIGYGSGRVTAVTNEGVTTNYSRFESGSGGLVTITDAASEETLVFINLDTQRVTSIFDPLERTTTYNYDSNGRLRSVGLPGGTGVQYVYDARGNVTETRASAKSGSGLPNMVTTASYDDTCANPVTCNQPNSVTDARGFTTDFTYDVTHGGVLTVTSPAAEDEADQPQTRYSYTQVTAVSGRPVYLPTEISACASGTASACVGTAAESRTVAAYDTDNLRLTNVTRRNGDNSLSATSTFGYDALGNLITADGPLSGTADTTRLRYDSARRVIGAVGPDPDGGGALPHRAERRTFTNGLPTKVEMGTVASQSDGDWAAFSASQRAEQDYDANARPTVARLMSGSTTYALTQTSYDGLGRVQCTAQRMNPSEFASLPSDACTLDTAGSHGPDRIVRNSYDAIGRVTLVQTGYGVSGVEADEVAMAYTGNDRVAHVTDANNNRTTYTYDGHDRLVRTQMPDPSTPATSSSSDDETLSYVTATVGGNARSTPLVASRTLRDDTSIAFGYDDLSRPISVAYPGSTADVGYTYDLFGRMLTAADSDGVTHSFAWDALGRQLSESSLLGTTSSQYDLADRRTLLTYPGSGLAVGYSYDTTGAVTEIRENPAGGNVLLASYSYDNLGRRTGISRGNGTSTSYDYDPVSRLDELVHNLNGTGSDLTLAFAYNPAGQLASNTRSNDAFSFTAHANLNQASTINGLNQVTALGPSSGSGGSGTSISHSDARGNVTAIGSSSYGYDAANRLISAPSSVAFGYDPLGRLRYSTGNPQLTLFAYDGQALIAELDFSVDILRRYVHGPGVDEPLVWYEGSETNTRLWFHQDERGSVIAVSDASGNLVGSAPNRYDEYGTPQGSFSGRFGYTGQMWLPEIGMYHYRARTYNPALAGRFMQTDPIGYGGGMNLYAYVGNDPVNFTDPSGLTPDDEFEVECTDYCGENVIVTGTRDFIDSVNRDIAAIINRQTQMDMSQYVVPGNRGGEGVTCVDAECEDIAVTAPPRTPRPPTGQTYWHFDGRRYVRDPLYREEWWFKYADTCIVVCAPLIGLAGAAVTTFVAVEGAAVGLRYGTGRLFQVRIGTDRLILRMDINKPNTHVNIQGRGFNWHIPPGR